jgi:hypothetical protein
MVESVETRTVRWEYVDSNTIRLEPAPKPFLQGYVYEFIYKAKDPLVLAVGLAATRDFVSFIRYATEDDQHNPNPVALPQYVYAFAVSQSARMVNDFQTLGFNTDEVHRPVFDGVFNWIGAGSGANINFRFGQTGRTERTRQHHLYPEGVFPFAYPALTDPYTGERAGRGVRCAAAGTCPKDFQVNSANEYWGKAASLLHTDLKGKDLPDPPNVRFFLASGVEHTVNGTPLGTPGNICQQDRNPTDPAPALRALFVDLDQWVSEEINPPKSEVPRNDAATSAFVVETAAKGLGNLPQRVLGWPTIPGVNYTGDVTARHFFNFGPHFDEGVMDINPPDFSGPVYRSFVSAVDADGNEIAGIRLPPVEAPIATTSGWGLRAAAFGGPDGCEHYGQYIPFKTTKSERLAIGDPRRSLEERYKNHDGYVKAVEKAVEKLQREHFLLPEDAQNYIEAAKASNVLLP